MRKYLATVLQVMALPKYQSKWVAGHLGHSMEIHAKYYRQNLDSVGLAKISKIMYLTDHGKMHEVIGKDLDSIDQFLSKEELFKGIGPEDYSVKYYFLKQYLKNCTDLTLLLQTRLYRRCRM